jgi:hypothetical protein
MAPTGIDERFPDVVYSLRRFDYDRDDDIYRCPECDSLFRWEDHPQFYGTGNLDEEILTRFTEDEAASLRLLLDLQSNFQNADQIVDRAFEVVPPELVNRVLMRLAIYKPEEFGSIVDSLVDHLIERNDSYLGDVLTTYCAKDPERIHHVIERIEASSRHKGSYVASALLVLRSRLEPESGDQDAR